MDPEEEIARRSEVMARSMRTFPQGRLPAAADQSGGQLDDPDDQAGGDSDGDDRGSDGPAGLG